MNAEIGMGIGSQIAAYKLQWGRALMNAEISRFSRVRSRSQFASMGPRSDERGNVFIEYSKADDHDASMGPRSDERGNPTACVWANIESPRFNGAAL